MSLKNKAVHGTKWLMISKFLNIGISFIFSMFLARLLGPTDFGLIGMTTVFITILNVFVTSGLGSSLIRTKDTTNEDYSTIFYFNLLICIVSYSILFLAAPLIADFYNQTILKSVVRVLGISVIISGLSMVQLSIRTKQINFKIQTIVSSISLIISGVIGILLAYNGYGVWSLVWQTIISSVLSTLMYWFTSEWRPNLFFSITILKKHFNYGIHILKSQLLIAISNNLFYLVIGKYYSATTLGLYTRSDTLVNLFSKNIEQTLNSVIFPTLCAINDDKERLIRVYSDFLSVTSFLAAFLTLNFVAVSNNFISVALGPSWAEVSHYMKILVVSAFFYPINTINIRIANVLGNSKIFANAIAFQRVLLVIITVIGIFTNFEVLLYGTIVISVITYIYNSQKVKEMLGISINYQFKDLLINSLPSIVGAFIIWGIGTLLPFSDLINLVLQILIGAIMYFLYFEKIKLSIYIKSKEMILGMLKKK